MSLVSVWDPNSAGHRAGHSEMRGRTLRSMIWTEETEKESRSTQSGPNSSQRALGSSQSLLLTHCASATPPFSRRGT